MSRIAERHRRAVELLNPQPGECVLEIGCGHGIATGLVLAGGATVVAVDRSAKMIAACKKRNPTVDARDVAFEQLDMTGFDAVLAVNVDFARNGEANWAQRLHSATRPDGRVVLVLESPGLHPAERFRQAVVAALTAAGFAAESIGQPGLVAVTATRLP
jgi:cyclopropane fatty-acyl-phospholipid synthase-like methyltransferase